MAHHTKVSFDHRQEKIVNVTHADQERNYPSFAFTCQSAPNFHVRLMMVVSRQLTFTMFTFHSQILAPPRYVYTKAFRRHASLLSQLHIHYTHARLLYISLELTYHRKWEIYNDRICLPNYQRYFSADFIPRAADI